MSDEKTYHTKGEPSRYVPPPMIEFVLPAVLALGLMIVVGTFAIVALLFLTESLANLRS